MTCVGASETNKRSKSCVSSMTVSNMKTRRKHNTKTTKILLCISTAFLILNGPIATSKIYYLLKHDFFGTLTSPSSSATIQKSHIEHLVDTSDTSDYYDDDDRLFNITNAFNLSHHLPSSFYDRNESSGPIKSLHVSSNYQHDGIDAKSGGGQANSMEKLIGLLTSNLYYLNFVLNFFLYSLNGPKFRRLFFGLFRRKFMRRSHVSTKPRRFKNVVID